jgi:hypothetical protein
VFHFGAGVWFFVKAVVDGSEQLRKQGLGVSMDFFDGKKFACVYWE